MKIEETIVTSHLDLKKLVRRSIQVSADILSETARYGQNVAKILLEDGGTDNRPLKHSEAASVSVTETTVESKPDSVAGHAETHADSR